jgi:hypothetical protein
MRDDLVPLAAAVEEARYDVEADASAETAESCSDPAALHRARL